jgi:hypothetical protein
MICDPVYPDWEIISSMLRSYQRYGRPFTTTLGCQKLASFAGVINGHAMITRFSTGACSFHCLDILCFHTSNALALEHILFQGRFAGPKSGGDVCGET